MAVSAWYAATDADWESVLAAAFAMAVSAVAWYGRVVVVEPTIWWRTFPNRWQSLDLSDLEEVDAYWGGREPHLELSITGKDGTSFTLQRRFWHRDWRTLFGYVAKWAERAEQTDPRFNINDKTIRRLGRYRHLVE